MCFYGIKNRQRTFPCRDNKIVLYCCVMYCIVCLLYCIVGIFNIVLYCCVMYCIACLSYCIVGILFCIVLYCIVFTVLHCIVLYYIILYRDVMFCIVLYCIVFVDIPLNPSCRVFYRLDSSPVLVCFSEMPIKQPTKQ